MTRECPLCQGNLQLTGGGGQTKGNPITPRSRLIHEPQEGNPSPVGSNRKLFRKVQPSESCTHPCKHPPSSLSLSPLFSRHGDAPAPVTHTHSAVSVLSARCEIRHQRGGIGVQVTSGSAVSNGTWVIYSSFYDSPCDCAPSHRRGALLLPSFCPPKKQHHPCLPRMHRATREYTCHFLLCTKLL